jgi:spermidine synthase
VADRGGNLARVFVLLQVLIGALAVGSVAVMGGLLYLFRALHGALPHGVFMGLQFALGAGLLLAPTVLMGMTFPVLSRHITGSLQESGFRVGAAFSANTLGTVAGALAGGFLLVPLLGLMGSAWVAGGLNLAAAALVLATSR